MSDLEQIARSLVFLSQMIAYPLGGLPDFNVEFDAETQRFISEAKDTVLYFVQILTSLYPGYTETVANVVADTDTVLEELDAAQLIHFSQYCLFIYKLNQMVQEWNISEEELEQFPPPDLSEDADEQMRKRYQALMIAHMLHSQIEARHQMLSNDNEPEATDSAE